MGSQEQKGNSEQEGVNLWGFKMRSTAVKN